MKVNLLGIRKNVRIANERTGEIIEGTSLYIGYKDENVVGQMTDKKFVRSTLQIPCMSELQPGQMLDLDLNTKGKVIDIAILK